MNARTVRDSLRHCLLGLSLCVGLSLSAQAQDAELFNPNWSIIIDDFGYSDLAFDQRPGFEGREYLSGEWASAITYRVNSTTIGPNWVNPEFLFPDWTPVSGFTAQTAIQQLPGLNAWGFPVYRSIVSDGSVRIQIKSEMIDTTNGIPLGLAPASGTIGSNILSDRYILRQTFSITNISGQTMTLIQFFKFLHALQTSKAVYDNRNYGPTFNGHRYASTQQGLDTGNNFDTSVPVLHKDTVTLLANVAPNAWEVGRYGVEDVDDHVLGKPSVGVHWSVESNALSNLDWFAPSNKWVSGAMRFGLGSLAPNAGTSLEFLMALHTQTTSLPLKIRRSGENVLISWPTGSLDFWFYELHTTTDLRNPNWQPVNLPVDIVDGENVVTVPITPEGAFFRLQEL